MCSVVFFRGAEIAHPMMTNHCMLDQKLQPGVSALKTDADLDHCAVPFVVSCAFSCEL